MLGLFLLCLLFACGDKEDTGEENQCCFWCETGEPPKIHCVPESDWSGSGHSECEVGIFVVTCDDYN